MALLKAVAVGILTYLGMVLVLLFAPVIAILRLWIALCVLASIFMFFFWLLITHSSHTLYSSLYMLAWGAPPFVAATVLGYFGGYLKARQAAPLGTFNRNTPFR